MKPSFPIILAKESSFRNLYFAIKAEIWGLFGGLFAFLCREASQLQGETKTRAGVQPM